EQAEWQLHRYATQVVLARVLDAEHARVIPRPPRRGDLHPALAAQVLPGKRRRVAGHVRHRPLSHDVATVTARSRTEVDHVIGLADRLLVMLHDDDRVAKIAKLLQRGEKTAVVALVQPDARLIQDVQHAAQTGAD